MATAPPDHDDHTRADDTSASGSPTEPWQQRRARRAEMEARNPLQPESDGSPLFKAQPDDGAVVRFFKRLGRLGQVVFGLLLAVFIAIVTFAAG